MKCNLANHIKITNLLSSLQQIGFTSGIINGSVVRNAYLIDDLDPTAEIPTVTILLWHPEHSPEMIVGYYDNNEVRLIQHAAQLDESRGWPDMDDSFEVTMLGNNHIFGSVVDYFIQLRKDNVKYSIMFTTINPIDYVKKETTIGLNRAYYNGKKMTALSDCINGYLNKEIYICRGNIGERQLRIIQKVAIPHISKCFPSYSVRYHIDLNI